MKVSFRELLGLFQPNLVYRLCGIRSYCGIDFQFKIFFIFWVIKAKVKYLPGKYQEYRWVFFNQSLYTGYVTYIGTVELIFSLEFCLFFELLKQKWNYCPGDMMWGEPLGFCRSNFVYRFFDMLYTMWLIFSLKFCLSFELLNRKWSEIF